MERARLRTRTGRFCPPLLWHHLAYAYVLESTGIVEIFAEVVRRLVVGQTLAGADLVIAGRRTTSSGSALPTLLVASVLQPGPP